MNVSMYIGKRRNPIRFTANFVIMCHIAHCPRITSEIRSITFRDGTGYVGLYNIKGWNGLLSFMVERVKHNPTEYEKYLHKLYDENHAVTTFNRG